MLALISNIINQLWAIEVDAARAQSPLIAALLKGNFDTNKDYSAERAKVHVSFFAGNSISSGPSNNKSFAEAPAGSIALIPLKGVIMKNDQFCGPVGTATIGDWLDEAKANPNIDAIILIADTPGGAVDGTETFANKVKETAAAKPVIAFVDTMAASAGMWAISGASLIVLAGETASVGSIGTMSTIFDMTEMLAMDGIKEIITYAPASSTKNEEFHQAIDGNKKPLEAKLSQLNTVFQNTIKTNRGAKLNSKDKTILSGSMFIGSSAIEAGLADEIGNMQYAINRAQELVAQNKNTSKNKTNMKFQIGKTGSAIAKYFGKNKAAEVVQEAATEIEMTAENFTQLDAEFAALQLNVNSLTQENTTLTSQLEAANAEVVRLTAENKNKNAVARTVALGNNAAEGGANKEEQVIEKSKLDECLEFDITKAKLPASFYQ